MPEFLRYTLYGYLLFVNLLAIILTVFDKSRAVHGKWRIRERTLLWCGFLGGALSMWITMLLIHHKTKHKKFMITLPVFALFHTALFCVLYLFG